MKRKHRTVTAERRNYKISIHIGNLKLQRTHIPLRRRKNISFNILSLGNAFLTSIGRNYIFLINGKNLLCEVAVAQTNIVAICRVTPKLRNVRLNNSRINKSDQCNGVVRRLQLCSVNWHMLPFFIRKGFLLPCVMHALGTYLPTYVPGTIFHKDWRYV